MVIKDDVVRFFKTSGSIAKVNFKFDGFMVYPQAYSVDIAGLISSDKIRVKRTSAVGEGAYAQYYAEYKEIWFRPNFNITYEDDRSVLLHEATHAHMDYKKVGMKPVEWSEAIAYLAEAFYREARGMKPLSGHFIRQKAHSLAKRMLTDNRYELTGSDATSMIMAAKYEPHYEEKARGNATSFPQPFVNFSGF